MITQTHLTSTTFPSFSLLLKICFLVSVLPLLYWIYHDYLSFKSLGPGGTPSTPLGYCKVKLLSLFKLRDPTRPPPIPKGLRPQTGFLSWNSLPIRSGERPKVMGIAPQRQVSQKGPQELFKALSDRIKILAAMQANGLKLGTSCFEKHGTGLFCLAPVTRTCKGEICHAHPSDGSLHMTLHPADAAIVLRQGWGERHPLARGGWFSRFVPQGFMMIYAPRDEDELRIVMEIIVAAAWWVGGKRIYLEMKEGAGGGKGEVGMSEEEKMNDVRDVLIGEHDIPVNENCRERHPSYPSLF